VKREDGLRDRVDWSTIPFKPTELGCDVDWLDMPQNITQCSYEYNNETLHTIITSVTMQPFIPSLSPFTTCFGLNQPSSGAHTLLKLLYCTEYQLFTSHRELCM
jgi:hypothetical protein